MAGSIELERDLIQEVISARIATKIPEDKAGKEAIANHLFTAFTELTQQHFPKDPDPEELLLPEGLTKEERELELRKKYGQFVAELTRQREIWESNHFLTATVLKGKGKVDIRMQLMPKSGYKLQTPAEFAISFPDSGIEEAFILREKYAGEESTGRDLNEEDEKTLMNLLSYINRPSTQIDYRRQSK